MLANFFSTTNHSPFPNGGSAKKDYLPSSPPPPNKWLHVLATGHSAGTQKARTATKHSGIQEESGIDWGGLYQNVYNQEDDKQHKQPNMGIQYVEEILCNPSSSKSTSKTMKGMEVHAGQLLHSHYRIRYKFAPDLTICKSSTYSPVLQVSNCCTTIYCMSSSVTVPRSVYFRGTDL